MTIARLDKRNQDFRDAKNHVYGLAHNVCLNGEEQRELLDFIRKIEEDATKDGGTGLQVIRNMLCPILDGLMWGNWPWSLRAIKEAANGKVHGGTAEEGSGESPERRRGGDRS